MTDEEGAKRAKRDLLADVQTIPGESWMLRAQNRFWQANLLATQKACGLWLSNLTYAFCTPKVGLLNFPNPYAMNDRSH